MLGPSGALNAALSALGLGGSGPPVDWLREQIRAHAGTAPAPQQEQAQTAA